MLTDPIVLLWILVLATGLTRWKKWRNLSFIIEGMAILWLLIFSTPFLPNLLIHSLESQYLPFDTTQYKYLQSDSIYIIVLASGYTADKRLPPSIQLSETSLVRLTEAIRIHRFLPQSTLITTASGSAGAPYSLAQVQALAANSLGVPIESCLPIPGPTNTREEALACRAVCGNKHPLILVTTANHMPRALMHFKNAGLIPIPAPTNYYVKQDTYQHKLYLMPNTHNSMLMHFALHEYIGYMWGKIQWSLEK